MTKPLITLLLLTGCSSFIEKRAASSTFAILKRGNVAASRLADVELARAAAPGGIVQMAAFAEAYPKHRGFRELYADAVCQYAKGFVFDDWEAAQLGGRADEARRIATRLHGLLTTCIDASFALLPDPWRAAAADNAKWNALLASAQREHVPALLHIGSAEAVRVAVDPMAAGIPRLQRAIATLTRCTTVAPGFRDAEGEIFLGSLLAGMSRFLGGADGEAQFAAARRVLGRSAILVDVVYARSIAVARGDRELFLRHLDAALAVDLSRFPDRRLSNELARLKAERYRAAVDSLIPATESGRQVSGTAGAGTGNRSPAR
jgi:hypothetical protein